MKFLYPFKNALWALRPAKPLGVLSRHPCQNPKPLPRGEGLCMLCWLCIVQSLWAYTPGIRAGAECGATAPRPSKDACSQPHKATMQGRIKTATQSRCTMQRHKWLTTCMGAPPKSKDAFVACPKFCTMQNQQSKQHSTPHFLNKQEVFRQTAAEYLPAFIAV